MDQNQNVDAGQAYQALLSRFAEVTTEATLKGVVIDQLQAQLDQLRTALDEPCAAACCQAKPEPAPVD